MLYTVVCEEILVSAAYFELEVLGWGSRASQPESESKLRYMQLV
jgi:hypothetical protein